VTKQIVAADVNHDLATITASDHDMQGNYAAANAAADAWASEASTAGRPCTAVQWGVWAEAGMAAAAGGLIARLARQARVPVCCRSFCDAHQQTQCFCSCVRDLPADICNTVCTAVDTYADVR